MATDEIVTRSGFRWGGPTGSQVVLGITVLLEEGVDIVDFGFLRTGAAGPFGGGFGVALGHLQVVV